ncbi:hypothetical protein [Ureibacillus sp. FSL K6-3587]
MLFVQVVMGFEVLSEQAEVLSAQVKYALAGVESESARNAPP